MAHPADFSQAFTLGCLTPLLVRKKFPSKLALVPDVSAMNDSLL
jgi:hypothetical protein